MRLSALHPPWVQCRVFNSHNGSVTNTDNAQNSYNRKHTAENDGEDEEESCCSATVASTITWSSASLANSSGSSNTLGKRVERRNSSGGGSGFGNPRQLLQNVFRPGGSGGYASRASLVMMKNVANEVTNDDNDDDDDDDVSFIEVDASRRTSLYSELSDSLATHMSFVLDDGSAVSHASPVCAKYPSAAEATLRHVSRHRGSLIARELNWSIKPDVLLDDGIESNPIHELPSDDEEDEDEDEEDVEAEEEDEESRSESHRRSYGCHHRHPYHSRRKVVRLRRRYYLRPHHSHYQYHYHSPVEYGNSNNYDMAYDGGEENDNGEDDDECSFDDSPTPLDYDETPLVIPQCPHCGCEQSLDPPNDEAPASAKEVQPRALDPSSPTPSALAWNFQSDGQVTPTGRVMLSEPKTPNVDKASNSEQQELLSTLTVPAAESSSNPSEIQRKDVCAAASEKARQQLLQRSIPVTRQHNSISRSDDRVRKLAQAKRDEEDDDDDDDNFFAAFAWWKHNPCITRWLQDSSPIACA